MESLAGAAPRTGVLKTRILWSTDRVQTLLEISNAIDGAGVSSGTERLRELESRWVERFPNLPAKGTALRQQLYRVKREAEKGGTPGEQDGRGVSRLMESDAVQDEAEPEEARAQEEDQDLSGQVSFPSLTEVRLT